MSERRLTNYSLPATLMTNGAVCSRISVGRFLIRLFVVAQVAHGSKHTRIGTRPCRPLAIRAAQSSMAPSVRAARAPARGASTTHADDASSLRARHRDVGVALDDASETGLRRDARLPHHLSDVACRNFGKSAGPWRRHQVAACVGSPSSARTHSHSTAF